jgi:hypothetical protein
VAQKPAKYAEFEPKTANRAYRVAPFANRHSPRASS